MLKNFARSVVAGLLLALLFRPPIAWRLRPSAHFWWLLLPSIGLSVVRDRSVLDGVLIFTADGLTGDALGALLTLALAAAIAALAAQRVLTWSLAVIFTTTSLWISELMLAVRWGLARSGDLSLMNEVVMTFATCVWWLLALQRVLTWMLPQWRWWRAGIAAIVVATLSLLPFFVLNTPRYFYPNFALADAEYADDEVAYSPERRVRGSAEALIYRQPAMLDAALAKLAPGTPGHTDAYLLAFAPDANEDVFRNEVEYAQTLFQQRFGMPQQTLVLLNHPDTTESTPLATLSNLRLALRGLASKMDADEDLLVLFLTTHGSEDHQLYVDLQPLPLDGIRPNDLREALDAAGIPWRVIIVSACYSGGFIEALQSPMSLVITAARADRPSFGCGADAEITYFGRALLVEALNQTRSFVAAFELAYERVVQREAAEEFAASEPQMALGALMTQKLNDWERTLAPAGAIEFVPTVPKLNCDRDDQECP